MNACKRNQCYFGFFLTCIISLDTQGPNLALLARVYHLEPIIILENRETNSSLRVKYCANPSPWGATRPASLTALRATIFLDFSVNRGFQSIDLLHRWCTHEAISEIICIWLTRCARRHVEIATCWSIATATRLLVNQVWCVDFHRNLLLWFCKNVRSQSLADPDSQGAWVYQQ